MQIAKTIQQMQYSHICQIKVPFRWPISTGAEHQHHMCCYKQPLHSVMLPVVAYERVAF
jgi:hypothetical protein